MDGSRIIIRFQDGVSVDDALLRDLERRAGVSLRYVRPMAGGAHVLRLDGQVPAAVMEEALQRLRQDPRVRYAEPDIRLKTQ